MLPNPDPIPGEILRRLHRRSLEGHSEVRRLLEQARRARAVLSAGINRRSERRIARIAAVGDGRLYLETKGISARRGRQLALNFELDGSHYFCVSRVLDAQTDGRVVVELPGAVYLTENRELFRAPVGEVSRAPTRVALGSPKGATFPAEVVDWSYHGVGLRVPARALEGLGESIPLRWLDGVEAGAESFGKVRYRAPEEARDGWVRIGLSVSRVEAGTPLQPERADPITSTGVWPGGAAAAVGSCRAPAESRFVEFVNDSGEPLRAVVDCWGDSVGATAVVIPPAWGRTKETLLPLSATIVESFRSAGEPVVVMRFDGTRRRGESYVPPECREEGLEHLQFTFSQAVKDTYSAIRFLMESERYRCGKAVLVTFSLSAVEGRRVVARDAGKHIAGWISVVGIADLQAALHVISGGVDYGYGLLRGLRFGRQELFGVLVDIDHSGLDAIEHGLSFLEDARRDMAAIRVPVTWINGRFDAWVDLGRVQALLSCGDTKERRLLDLPIGHQLRSSAEAFSAFRLIAGEVARMSLGRTIEPTTPDLEALVRQRAAERERLPRVGSALRPFWRDYLLGREGGGLGIEILTATETYRDFMAEQTALLGLRERQRVADLGAGTGDFCIELVEGPGTPKELDVHAVDFVPQALARGMSRLARMRTNGGIRVFAVAADLDCSAGTPGIPLASRTFDAVLASLLLSYVRNPEALLGEIHRILRPTGTLVVSTLRRDADISKIYVDSLAERYSERPREVFGASGAEDVDRSLPQFLNSASRIIDWEERGRFRFFDSEELVAILDASGFVDPEVSSGLGDPPQAVLVKARRR